MRNLPLIKSAWQFITHRNITEQHGAELAQLAVQAPDSFKKKLEALLSAAAPEHHYFYYSVACGITLTLPTSDLLLYVAKRIPEAERKILREIVPHELDLLSKAPPPNLFSNDILQINFKIIYNIMPLIQLYPEHINHFTVTLLKTCNTNKDEELFPLPLAAAHLNVPNLNIRIKDMPRSIVLYSRSYLAKSYAVYRTLYSLLPIELIWKVLQFSPTIVPSNDKHQNDIKALEQRYLDIRPGKEWHPLLITNYIAQYHPDSTFVASLNPVKMYEYMSTLFNAKITTSLKGLVHTIASASITEYKLLTEKNAVGKAWAQLTSNASNLIPINNPLLQCIESALSKYCKEHRVSLTLSMHGPLVTAISGTMIVELKNNSTLTPASITTAINTALAAMHQPTNSETKSL